MKKNYLIFGFEKSGQSAFNLIYNKKDSFYIYDNDDNKLELAQKLTNLMPNVKVVSKLDNNFIKTLNTIIISPGVSIYNKNIIFAKKNNVEVVSELELGFRFLKHVKIIAITGTNGKTTTTRLIEHILNNSNKTAYACGNIGVPICDIAKKTKKGDILVCETSSFQLEAIDKFKPNIACILNITLDHINRHKTFRNYKKTKLKIFKNFDKKSILVYSTNIKINSNYINFVNYKLGSFKYKNSCYVKQNCLYVKSNNKSDLVLFKKDIPLIGKHNLQNVMCAITVCKILKVKNINILNALKTFKLNNHRLQFVYSKDNVSFYDDSKATNIDATICAIKSFNKPTILILGGSDKGYSYDKIFENISKNIVNVLCCGEVKQKIYESAKKYNIQIEQFDTLKMATERACFIANQYKKDINVLLSPASASFDEFKNYKERGVKFLEYIRDYYA